jgi:hypothetical protein
MYSPTMDGSRYQLQSSYPLYHLPSLFHLLGLRQPGTSWKRSSTRFKTRYGSSQLCYEPKRISRSAVAHWFLSCRSWTTRSQIMKFMSCSVTQSKAWRASFSGYTTCLQVYVLCQASSDSFLAEMAGGQASRQLLWASQGLPQHKLGTRVNSAEVTCRHQTMTLSRQSLLR